jgi:hypothetical protein
MSSISAQNGRNWTFYEPIKLGKTALLVFVFFGHGNYSFHEVSCSLGEGGRFVNGF